MIGSMMLYVNQDKKLKKALDKTKKAAQDDKPETWTKMNAFIKVLQAEANMCEAICEEGDDAGGAPQDAAPGAAATSPQPALSLSQS